MQPSKEVEAQAPRVVVPRQGGVIPAENGNDVQRFFEFLYAPHEHVEVRYRELNGNVRTFFVRGRDPTFWNKTIPILNRKGAIVWAGVCPRQKEGTHLPLHGRALWCDFDATVISVEQAASLIEESGLPHAHMLVWTGNGVHAYWKLNRACPPEELSPRLRGIHELLPTDATHDPTRIMALPGTINNKDPKNPKPRYIAEHREGTYELADFPVAAERDTITQEPIPTSKIELSDEDRDTMIAAMVDGQKHYVLLGFAAYLRKKLAYSQQEARDEVELILNSAGYDMDRGAEKIVSDTYAKEISSISTGSLVDTGVALSSASSGPINVKFKSTRTAPAKPLMRVVDLHAEYPEQEFWIPGLIGPGLFTLWAAPTKVGKSFAAMQIAHGLATGMDVWDFPVTTRRRTLYFQGELSYAMVHTRARQMFSYIPPAEWLAMTDKPDKQVNLAKTPELLYDMAEKYDVVVVDPISVFSTGGNDNDAVNETIALFDPLIAAGKAVMVVQHMRKLGERPDGTPRTPTAEDIRGAGQWYARPDAIAVHAPVGRDMASVSFTFRAAPDRGPLRLWRMPNGSWTHDRDTWYATKPGLVGAIKPKPRGLRVNLN